MLELSGKQKRYVEEVTSKLLYFDYDYKKNRYYIDSPDITWEQVKDLNKAVNIIRSSPIRPGVCEIKLKDIKLGFYDRCLQYYCEEILDGKKKHKDACWPLYAEKIVCVGKIHSGAKITDLGVQNICSDLKNRDTDIPKQVIKRYKSPKDFFVTEDGWVLFHSEKLNINRKLTCSLSQKIKNKLFKKQRYDRVIDLVQSIRDKGWDTELAYKPSGSVLMYSKKTGQFTSLTGRHRICALLYLYAKGEISGELVLDYPIIEHNFDGWMHSTGKEFCGLCKKCSILNEV